MVRNQEKLKLANIENQKILQEQKQKELKAVKKFVYGQQITGQDFLIFYDTYAEKYSINQYGEIGKVETILDKSKINMNYIKSRYTEI